MADCQDLFMSRMDDDYDMDPCSGSKAFESGLRAPQPSGVLSDAEPFLYTSSSESDMDACFSDIEPALRAVTRDDAQLHSQTTMPPSDKRIDRDIILHSPGQLLGTPRDSSRRYEYPFPAHLRVDDAVLAEDSASSVSSASTTPGLTPGEGFSLGLVPFAGSSSAMSSSTSMPIYMQAPTPSPIPVPVPISSPHAIPKSSSTGANLSRTSLSPLAQAPAVVGPSSAPALGVSSIAAHPKLSRFNPADTPVPPGLRGRTRKSASVSVPQALQPVANTVAPVPVSAATVGSS